jgi:hypothetical protein
MTDQINTPIGSEQEALLKSLNRNALDALADWYAHSSQLEKLDKLGFALETLWQGIETVAKDMDAFGKVAGRSVISQYELSVALGQAGTAISHFKDNPQASAPELIQSMSNVVGALGFTLEGYGRMLILDGNVAAGARLEKWVPGWGGDRYSITRPWMDTPKLGANMALRFWTKLINLVM